MPIAPGRTLLSLTLATTHSHHEVLVRTYSARHHFGSGRPRGRKVLGEPRTWHLARRLPLTSSLFQTVLSNKNFDSCVLRRVLVFPRGWLTLLSLCQRHREQVQGNSRRVLRAMVSQLARALPPPKADTAGPIGAVTASRSSRPGPRSLAHSRETTACASLRRRTTHAGADPSDCTVRSRAPRCGPGRQQGAGRQVRRLGLPHAQGAR